MPPMTLYKSCQFNSFNDIFQGDYLIFYLMILQANHHPFQFKGVSQLVGCQISMFPKHTRLEKYNLGLAMQRLGRTPDSISPKCSTNPLAQNIVSFTDSKRITKKNNKGEPRQGSKSDIHKKYYMTFYLTHSNLV